MDDLRPLAPDELRAHLGPAIARRLDATTTEDRARAGDDLLRVLVELARRGFRPFLAPDAHREDAGPTALEARPAR